MTVPDYQSVMLPLLKALGDGEEHGLHEVIETLADQFELTDEERRELLPSGRQAKFDNRVGWARTYLKKGRTFREHGKGKVPNKRSRSCSPERESTGYQRQVSEAISRIPGVSWWVLQR